MEDNICYDTLTEKDMYYGRWIKCSECGYIDNIRDARYCGGCGKKLIVVGVEDEGNKEG